MLSFIICGVMALSASPLTAFADDSGYTGGLCEHHREHNEECGYIEAAEESPCTHEHTEECYRLVTDCVHEHTEECYLDGILPTEGEEKTADACAHVCSEENGCIVKELDCNHEHNDDCGYVPAIEGSPCGYWCGICAGETEESDKAEVTDEIDETDEIDKTEEIDETDETEESEKSFSPMSERAIEPKKPKNGNGTMGEPYQISTAGELYWFAHEVNGGKYDACAILTEDITINENVLDEDGNLNGNGSGLEQWPPIGSYGISGEEAYIGTFDGNGHTISGLYVDSDAQYVGLFGCVGTNGKIQNVGVVDSYISATANGAIVGGVCGHNYEGTIENCYNTGTVTGSGINVGGVCGGNSWNIINCYNTGKVSTTDDGARVGGVCGYNTKNIKNCYNTGKISVTIHSSFVGGVCGMNFGGINNCYFLTGTADKGIGVGSSIFPNEATEKTENQFKSGEVAWLLQNGQEEQVWGQKIGVDSYPKFSDSENEKVLKAAFMNSVTEIQVAYANYNTALTEPEFVVAEDEKIDGWYENGDFSGDEWDFENGIVQDITLHVKISKIQYNVTLKADGDGAVFGGGTYVHGTEVTVTADPDSGFRFVRWEENGTEVSDEAEYTFIIKGDRELTAVFERRSTDSGHSGGSYSLPEGIDRDEPEKQPEYRPDEPSTPETPGFIDVDIFDWYHDGVMYVTENGIMNGVGGNRFEPEAELKREMLAVILWNMTDNPEPNGIAPFLDVTSDKYYAKAIAWANENGVMYGYGEEFGVGEAVTREDFAAILYRYAAFKGYDTTQGGMAVREFIDFEQIADYAAEALGWAVNSGIISGMGDGTVSPKTSTYRGQAAVMLMKFCENIME